MFENSRGRRARGGDTGRDAEPVVGGTGEREARLPGHGAPHPGDQVGVAHVVLREPTTPPADPRLHRKLARMADIGHLGDGHRP
jgi:hypothetical protein